MDQNVLQMNQERSEDELAVVNISSTEIGALSKEAAERILQTKDTDDIHLLMYVPIEKKADLNWLIESVGQALGDEDEDNVALEFADLLYFFIIPFYKEYIVREHHLYECIDDLLVRLASRAHSDIQTLVDAMRDDLTE
ncbi:MULTISPECIES: hypothetical protein [Bacillus]|uniref:Uncharacterized protein n=1 Tax=Bacillus pumilus TaxID=1408 RepID=A0A2G8IUA2_BACPU|nr:MULTISPECIES: hypothetical protein [Bacillus]MCC9090190.1 hypothetical protein [Bacillus pumilus]PIK27019.1 hypothetical protein CTV99_09930 [Bacillus pumilus]UUD43280.1 hypothetical protein NPA43_03015 [Bacillus pumilus]